MDNNNCLCSDGKWYFYYLFVIIKTNLRKLEKGKVRGEEKNKIHCNCENSKDLQSQIIKTKQVD